MRMNRNERGATTIFVAALIAVLLAAVGIGIDTTSMTYQRSRVQHAADASALAIARICANGGACSNSAGQVVASDFMTKNAPGGGTDSTPNVNINTGTGTVIVTQTKSVKTMFFGLLGISSKTESASATATWGSYQRGNVKPFLVSLCEYTKVATNVTTFLDANSSNDANGYSKNDPQQILLDDNNLTSGCGTIPTGLSIPNVPSGAGTRMVIGGLWKNSNGSAGNASISNSKSILTVGDYGFELGAAKTDGNKTEGYIDPGPVLFAIYAPTRNFKFGGAVITGPDDVPTSKFSGNAVTFSFKVVGFAPFNVAAVRLGSSGNPLQGVCPAGFSPCSGVGIWGSFVNEASLDGLAFTPGGANIGTTVKLTN